MHTIRKIYYVHITEARCASWSGRKSLASKTSCIVRRLDESLAQLGQRALSIPPESMAHAPHPDPHGISRSWNATGFGAVEQSL